MAQSKFTYGETKKVTPDDAKKSAQKRDEENANWHIPAAKDEVLTLTGDFYEKEWEYGTKDSKDYRSGTILMAEAAKADGSKIPIPISFFKEKRLREEDGMRTFAACFNSDTTFESIVGGIEQGKKIKVCREPFVFPGSSSARDIDTVVWAK